MTRVFRSVRARLTLWYVGTLGVVLIVFSAGVYLLLARNLYDRLDARLASTLHAAATALNPALTGPAVDVQAVNRALEELRFPNQSVALLDATGQVIAQRTGPGGPALRLPAGPHEAFESVRFYELEESEPDKDDSCRGAVQRISQGATSAAYELVVVHSVEPLSDQLDLVLNFLYVVVLVSLILAGAGGWFLAHRSLAPVVAMTERVQRISAENLEQRLEISNPEDEIGRLASTFNDLLARLRSSFAQQQQFMTDASHELRTPLSAIRTASAVTLEREDREKSEYREALRIVEQEARRLTRIVEDMFLLARADAGHPSLRHTKFYLDELLNETARAAAVLAGQKHLQVITPALPEAPFWGDEGLLRQMLWNLLDNAIKYTPEGGQVKLALELRDSEYVVSVTDTGSGIPCEAQANIFERFSRGDQARSRGETAGEGGAGLGLPIARWIAEAHRGRLVLQRSDATGSTFAVFLPHAASPA
jgi:heavy metal sensor kinase